MFYKRRAIREAVVVGFLCIWLVSVYKKNYLINGIISLVLFQVLTEKVGVKSCKDVEDALDPITLNVLPYIWQMRLAEQLGVSVPPVPACGSCEWNETHGRIAPDFRKHAKELGIEDDTINVCFM